MRTPFVHDKIIEPLESRVLLSTTYTIVDLGAIGGGSSQALAINDLGQVVGISIDSSGREHAFLWQSGTLTDLGLLNGEADSSATAINASSKIAGIGINSDGDERTILLNTTAGAAIDLGDLGGGSSEANGINSIGLVVGSSTLSDGADHAALFTAPAGRGTVSTVKDLGTLGGFDSRANGINASNDVVGEAELSSGVEHAFLELSAIVSPTIPTPTPTPTMQDLGTLGGSFSDATAINATNQVVGGSTDSSDLEHAFLWQSNVMTDLGTLAGGSTSIANAINSLGQVVGESDTSDGAEHAFIWQSGVMTDLNPAAPEIEPYIITAANGINSSGEIAATGINDAGVEHALLLIPTTTVDRVPPTGKLTSAPILTRGDRTNYDFTVTYTDNVAVNVSTLGDSNILVRGPNRARFTEFAKLVSISPRTNAATVVATYAAASPSGTWTSTDNGVYSVTLEGRSVADTAGNSARQAVLGSFEVDVVTPAVARPSADSAILTAGSAAPAASTGSLFSTLEIPPAMFE